MTYASSPEAFCAKLSVAVTSSAFMAVTHSFDVPGDLLRPLFGNDPRRLCVPPSPIGCGNGHRRKGASELNGSLHVSSARVRKGKGLRERSLCRTLFGSS
jgi:hypothetical protein